MSEEPRRVLDLGSFEGWQLGGVVTVMPKLNRAWPKRLRAAWRRRLMANLTGVCECGGELRSVGMNAQVGHVAGCPASDEVIGPMLEAES